MENEGREVGKITRFFDKIGVAVVEVSDELNVGDRIKIKGNTTDFEQDVDSMQVEHQNVEKAVEGDSVGMKVVEKVRPNDRVFVI